MIFSPVPRDSTRALVSLKKYRNLVFDQSFCVGHFRKNNDKIMTILFVCNFFGRLPSGKLLKSTLVSI